MIDEKIKSLISAIVILAVQILALCGISVDADLTFKVVLICVNIITTGYAIWKNHNFTDAAVTAQQFLDELKGL